MEVDNGRSMSKRRTRAESESKSVECAKHYLIFQHQQGAVGLGRGEAVEQGLQQNIEQWA